MYICINLFINKQGKKYQWKEKKLNERKIFVYEMEMNSQHGIKQV